MPYVESEAETALVDVVVIGGKMAGLSPATAVADEGFSVCLIEATAIDLRRFKPVPVARISRDRWEQRVPPAGSPMPGLPLATGSLGLFHASPGHIYPQNRGVSLAVKLGRGVASETTTWLGHP